MECLAQGQVKKHGLKDVDAEKVSAKLMKVLYKNGCLENRFLKPFILS